ncbi:MAG: hypothetical protein EPO52_17025 [Herbiconiux sp.]|uniref:hypothetical protein n=1 Tax=Herbiconiux sp. TaxID=1871186 RepID=UPI0012080EF0|nr:hypothetical protein [Herbiconiux sp.]TAJ46240.1 MAG: hypothetical protein EPO52_17025 [Herbiconiux sp.]
MNRDRILSLALILLGAVLLVVALVLDLNGGPSWLHFFTWIGGGLTGYGIVLLARSGPSNKPTA